VDATDRFLGYVTGTGEPIVFLLPPQALTHPKGTVTKDELNWFLGRPERMANVRFVLGAYDFVSGEPENDARAGAMRSLSLWRGGHEPSPDEARWAQRVRHLAARGESPLGPHRPEGAEREAMIEEFLQDMASASYPHDRGSTGRFIFQGRRGMDVLHRV